MTETQRNRINRRVKVFLAALLAILGLGCLYLLTLATSVIDMFIVIVAMGILLLAAKNLHELK